MFLLWSQACCDIKYLNIHQVEANSEICRLRVKNTMVTFHIQESLFCFKNWMLLIFLELFPQPWLSRTMLWLKHIISQTNINSKLFYQRRSARVTFSTKVLRRQESTSSSFVLTLSSPHHLTPYSSNLPLAQIFSLVKITCTFLTFLH